MTQDEKQFIDDIYGQALARAGLKYRGMLNGIPEMGLQARVLFDGSHKNTCALPITEFTVEGAVRRARESDAEFEQ